MIGFNFRLTELQAAIGLEQLKKLDKIVKKKQKNANYLSKNLKNLKGLIPPIIDKKKFTHAFYMYPLRLDHKIIKTHKNKIFRMLANEGIPIAKRYEDISKLPSISRLSKDYKKQFKIINLLNQKEYLGIKMWAFDFSIDDLDYIILKFKKIWDKLNFKK